jgi:hypothetical protein
MEDKTEYLVVYNKIVSEIVTVLYTPGQLRSAVSIAPETYRHWKKALGPLRRGRGHSPCFSSGDLLAVAVIRLLAVDMSIRVGALTPIADVLFELCNVSSWPVLERSKFLIDLPGGYAQLHPDLAEVVCNRPTITVPLGPVVAGLRVQLLAANEMEGQASLHLPPVVVGSVTSTRGRRS